MRYGNGFSAQGDGESGLPTFLRPDSTRTPLQVPTYPGSALVKFRLFAQEFMDS